MLKRVVWSDHVKARIETSPSRFTGRSCLEARSAASLGELLDLVWSARTDLIVLDLESEQLPAGTACARLRADERTAAIPILVLAAEGADHDELRRLGCNQVIPSGIESRALQERIATALGMRLRRHQRYEVVLPVARGRIFHEFLGYSNSLSESGMGFDTISRIHGGEQLNLKIYRSTEEKPISVGGRVCGVRANIDTGIGYSVGIEFMRLGSTDKQRLQDLFPEEPCVTWGSDGPGQPGVEVS
jgi:CheY-like chemotaxis protein